MAAQNRQTVKPISIPAPAKSSSSRARLLAGLAMVALIAIVYSNSLQAPLIFDDIPSISINESIKHLSTAFSPPKNSGATVAGRPVLNASFALNHALTGTSVPGLHITNLLIHSLAALVLWGILRRTLEQPLFQGRYNNDAVTIAWLATALWAVHPLQTESVTYVVQRAESLVGLFYLLTLYAFIRSNENNSWRGWSWLTVIACLAGMGSKEVMATAPLIVLLYDRTFLSGTFRESVRRHGLCHAALASTWLLLCYLVITNGARGNSVGFSGEVTPWNYLCTQSYALVRYLGLSICPVSLTLDYGTLIVKDLLTVVLCGTLVTVLLAATVYALFRRPRAGFLGAWFFVILAPTSSAIPVITQTVAEHRMYLPLAAVTTAVVLLALQVGAKYRTTSLAVLMTVAGVMTWQRNLIYGSAISIWEDTVAKQPKTPRALNNLGLIYGDMNRLPEAIKLFSYVLILDPNTTETNYNLASALARIGRDEESIKYYQASIAAKADNVQALANFGAALQRLGRIDEAITEYETALRFDPRLAESHYNLGLALLLRNRAEEGLIHLRESVQLSPNDAGYLQSLVRSLSENGHGAEAIPVCENLAQIKPTADNYTFLGVLYARNGRLEKARDAFLTAIQIAPGNIEANDNLAKANTMLAKSRNR